MKKKKVIFEKDKKNIEIICEVAKTIVEKTNGLMNREKLEKNKGMLFSFILPWYRFFWMKNVKIPLDIIYVNRKNRIIKIHEAPVEKELGLSDKQEVENYGISDFNKECKKCVFKYENVWVDMTKRIGFWLDMNNPYITLENDYIKIL